ncbi:helix-turn-helix domain-containing protein [Flammeovirga aprica]|uniref:Helix-turn-helix domain-containing protein n=1 Tax=Flammeovirga aprica JL-4 TaxID=694437 RepID=A0A7X9XDB3_9BACT|nr:helix-turn-helix domain-containing protein [Flammeovirga aprica]NME72613.1 helix-turn-helix domain-containing protein [Flammeovirga aprica JL-4]
MLNNNLQKIEVIINGTKMIIEDQEKIQSITDIILSDTISEKASVLITSQQAADLLGMSRPTLVKLSDNGKIPFTKNGNRRMYYEKDIRAYQLKREQGAKNIGSLVDLSEDLNLEL